MRKAAARMTVSAVAFLLAAGVTCFALQMLFPAIDPAGTAAHKLAALASDQESDLLFLGSSRVRYQLVPEQFDEATRAAGRNVRSFNLGVDGMFAPEDSYMLERALEVHPVCRWVVIEATSILAGTTDAKLTQRFVQWHDTARLLSVWRFCAPERKPAKDWRKRRDNWKKHAGDLWAMRTRLWPHLMAYAQHLVSLGQGALRMRDGLQGGSRTAAAGSGVSLARGYEAGASEIDPQEQAFVASQLAAWQAGTVTRIPMPGEAQRNLERMLARVRAAGAQPLVFIAPNPGGACIVPSKDTSAPVLDFCSLERYPSLYRLELWRDRGHLNERGAQVFTRLMAEEWVQRTH